MKQVLIDTSVWVSHFRRSNGQLTRLLELDLATTHPMVLMELACGTPPEPRLQTLGDIATLNQIREVTLNEARNFIERESLFGLGCGLVDVMLLSSVLITQNTELWTLDKNLHSLAKRFDVQYQQAVFRG